MQSRQRRQSGISGKKDQIQDGITFLPFYFAYLL